MRWSAVLALLLLAACSRSEPAKPGEPKAAPAGARVARRPVEGPRPGTPGGLPDDRRASEQGSAGQDATTALETYFALVEGGKTAEAAKLRRGGEDPRAGWTEFHAQVGRPGPVEDTDNAVYVPVPVSIYGRDDAGAAMARSGKVVLRRVDVPGLSDEQLSWRIQRIELDPPVALKE
jgi:hypothetical protein